MTPFLIMEWKANVDLPELIYCFVRIKTYTLHGDKVNWGNLLKSSLPPRSLKGRMRELEKISARIDAKMTKLEKIIAVLSKTL